MKKILGLILGIASLFTSINIVKADSTINLNISTGESAANALTCTGSCGDSSHSSTDSGVISVTTYIASVNGKSTELYCKDPGLSLITDSGQMCTATVSPLDPNGAHGIHDTGIIYILDHAENYNAPTIEMAVRIFDYLFSEVRIADDSIIEGNWKAKRNRDYNIILAAQVYDAWGLSKYQSLGVRSVKDNPKYSKHWDNNSTVTITNGSISLENVRQLVIGALDEASKASNPSSSENSSKGITPIKEGELSKKIENINGVDSYVATMEYSYNVQGFDPETLNDPDGDSILLKSSCTDCDRYGVTFSAIIKINDREIATISNNSDLNMLKNFGVELLKDYITSKDKVKLTVLLKFTAPKENFECINKPNYTFDLFFTRTNDDGGSKYALIDVQNCGGSKPLASGEYQDIYGNIIEWEEVDDSGENDGGNASGGGYAGSGDSSSNIDKNKYPNNYSFTGAVDLCTSCTILKEDCDKTHNDNSPECQNYKNQCDCDKLKTDCENTNNPNSPECEYYVYQCPTPGDEPNCDTLKSECDMTLNMNIVGSNRDNILSCRLWDLYCDKGSLEDCDNMDEICANDPYGQKCQNLQTICPNNKDCDKLDEICEENPNSQQCKKLIQECPIDCSKKDDICSKDPTSPSCQRLSVECPSNCSTYVSSVSCTTGSESSDLVVREGTEGTQNCNPAANVDVNKCVVNGKDLNENLYNKDKIGGIDFSDNQFCKVACIENFKVNLPDPVNKTSGRWFTISASIDGGQQCYTSKINVGSPVNPKNVRDDALTSDGLLVKRSFEYKYEVAREIIFDAMNVYSFYKGLNNIEQTDIVQHTPDDMLSLKGNYQPICYSGTFWDGWGCGYYDFYGNYNRIEACSDPQVSQYVEKRVYEFDYVTYDYSYGKNSSSRRSATERIKNGTYYYTDSNFNTSKITVQCTGGNTSHCTITSEGSYTAGSYFTTCQPQIVNNAVEINADVLFKIGALQDVKDTRPDFIQDALYTFSYNNALNAISTANNTINKYNQKIEDYISDLNDCSSWTMDSYDIEADMKFEYEESYINDLTEEEKTLIKDVQGSNSSVGSNNVSKEYCTGTITFDQNGKPTGCNGSSGTSNSDSSLKMDKEICKVSGDSISCETKSIPKIKQVYQSKISTVNYSSKAQFQTLMPSGTIIKSENQDIEDSIPLGEGWPLEFTGKGVYTYRLYVNKLGQYSDGTYGRIWDYGSNKDTIVSKAADIGCTGDSIHKGKDNTEYFCAYKVNCNNCPSKCDPNKGICEEDDDDCPNGKCPSRCKGVCIVDGDINVSTRPTSPNNINPNDRQELGLNWRWNEPPQTALELKAYVTTQEIQEDGEKIFDAYYEDQTILSSAENNNSVAHFVINSAVYSVISEWNSNHPTYTDDSLTYYNYTDQNGNVLKGIFGYSPLIDELYYNEKTRDFVNITNRITGTNEQDSIAKRTAALNQKENGSTQGYWTTWDSANLNKWQIVDSINLNEIYNVDFGGEDSIIGPAWK